VTDPDSNPPVRPSLGAMLSNWSTYEAPLATKLRMVVSNNWTKLRHRQNCCGHPGQPGC
jgi:hypothetical protein